MNTKFDNQAPPSILKTKEIPNFGQTIDFLHNLKF